MTTKKKKPKKESLLRIVGHRLSDLQVLYYPIVRVLARLWCLCMHHLVRSERRGPLFEYIKQERPCIIAYWHQDSMPLLFELIRYTRGYPCSAMLSRGRIGDFSANLLAPWHFRFARGSNSGGSKQALLQLTQDARDEGRALFCTVDGSQGPARQARWGAVYLARDTGLPIVLARAWGTNLTVFEKAWMKLGFPWPWGRAVFLSEGPIRVPANASEDELEAIRADLEVRLNQLADASVAYVAEGAAAAEPYGPEVLGMEEAESRRVDAASAPPIGAVACETFPPPRSA
ncbi:MAG: DUF374 domain-containing protein [Candidatus Binatia bacterium]|nr:DUF374 domain-containing protein [Candidatus Binatia bacterium]